MENPSPVLSIRKVCKSFSGIEVLHEVDLDLYPGEVHGLVGENGAGKSTLIKIISGAYQPDRGEIHYQSEAVRNIDPRWARANGINTIYQEIDLIPSLSAAENISLGVEPLNRFGNIDWPQIQTRAKSIFAEMGIPLHVDTKVGLMNIAHQQMVAIAKALSLNSRVIIFDEPTAFFTSSETELLFKIIKKLKSQEIAILYISHHLDEIFQIGERVTVLRDGHLVRSGKIAEFDKNSLVKAMVGREIDFTTRHASESTGEELLRVKGLSLREGQAGIDFLLRKGEILGIAGLVGAGRTELARMIIGADRKGAGEIFLKGKKVHFSSPQKSLLSGVGMLPESRKDEGLVAIRSMSENIGYSVVEKSARFNLVPWKQVKVRVREMITALEIRPDNPNIQVVFMSGGNQQKVVLSKLLAAQCDVLILDEPTRGVDVGARMEIYALMRRMKEEGKAILMISSDLPEILTQADRILVMAKGRIVGELASSEATEEKVLKLALQLKSEAV